ncbi:hypothetical protein RB195_024782 [Necator americanus]|uniref:Uncharacterized protein n=1 Tax=Necator americanus TaxID=51031 RepID=A0ABR1EPJ8_NECAM
MEKNICYRQRRRKEVVCDDYILEDSLSLEEGGDIGVKLGDIEGLDGTISIKPRLADVFNKQKSSVD